MKSVTLSFLENRNISYFTPLLHTERLGLFERHENFWDFTFYSKETDEIIEKMQYREGLLKK